MPASFSQTDPQRLRDVIDRHGFATLISCDETEPIVSHLPLSFVAGAEAEPDRLVGHMARANPHWRQADGRPVLAVFHGPHAYISPSSYQTVGVVPTWNYVVVHVHGRLLVQSDVEQVRAGIERMVEKYEQPRPAPWSLAGEEPEFVDRLLQAVVGFEIEIDRIEGKWKLSQNHDAERRDRVIGDLKNGDDGSRRIAEMMREFTPE